MKRISACALSLALAASLILPAGAAGSTFSDVPETHWAYAYVEEVASFCRARGVSHGLIVPEEPFEEQLIRALSAAGLVA